MKTVAVMWDFLPEYNYAYLLLLIIHKLEVGREELDGEGKSFDYRGLLREFWCQSHERHKMFVLNNEAIIDRHENSFEAGVILLMQLFCLPNFTDKDYETIQIIFAVATDKQKENIIYSGEWQAICNTLIRQEKWEILNRLDRDDFFTKTARANFKKRFCCLEIIKRTFFPFLLDDKWNSVECFIKWTSLPEEDIKKLTRDIISSDRGMEQCLSLVCVGKTEAAEKLISWSFPSEQDARLFKNKLIFSESGTKKCKNLILQNKMEFSNEFIHFFVSSSEEIKKIKTKIAYDFGGSICKEFISGFEGVIFNLDADDGQYDKKVQFMGGKWEEVEKFITFCFSSEDEINDFKKNCVLNTLGRDIHFRLIQLCKLEEAETFFYWLDLSADEVKKLKKETLFYHREAKRLFIELIHTELGLAWFVDYGNKDEAIELLLRWFLIDRDTVLEFRDEYSKWYQDLDYTNKDDVLRNLNLIIERRLEDFDIELD